MFNNAVLKAVIIAGIPTINEQTASRRQQPVCKLIHYKCAFLRHT